MKLISIILLFTSIASAHLPFVSSEESLNNILLALQPGEFLWIRGGLADSIENQIIQEMIQEFPWQKTPKGWSPLTFEDYRRIILTRGLSILHTEVHREIVHEPELQWISSLGLTAEEQIAFTDEFILRFKQLQGGIQRELLMQVGFLQE